MMTNKQSQLAKAQFWAGHPSDFSTPLTQVVLPLCGGVVGTDQQNFPVRTIKWGEVAIALLLSGTVLAWLTTIPLWWPQPRFQTYSTTLSDASLPIMNL